MKFDVIARDEVLGKYDDLATSEEMTDMCAKLGCSKKELQGLVDKLRAEQAAKEQGDPRPSAAEHCARREQELLSRRPPKTNSKIYGGSIEVAPMPRHKSKVMSAEDEQMLVQMANSGESCMRIAEKIGCELSSVYSKIKYLKNKGKLNTEEISKARKELRASEAKSRVGADVREDDFAFTEKEENKMEIENGYKILLDNAAEENEGLRGLCGQYEEEIANLKMKLSAAESEIERRQYIINDQIERNKQLYDKVKELDSIKSMLAKANTVNDDSEKLRAQLDTALKKVEAAHCIVNALVKSVWDVLTV